MADNIKFTVLDVGQGSGNFVEIRTGTTIDKTVLIDLGSEYARTEAGEPTVDYLVERLKSMTNPAIEYVFLSHSDSDHINLIGQLLDEFDPPGSTVPPSQILTVHNVVYGGFYPLYTKSVRRKKVNILDRLDTYMPTNRPVSCGASANSFHATTPVGPYTVDGVDFYILVGNVAAEATADFVGDGSKRDGFAINSNSVVVAASYAGTQYIATGDATGKTLAKMREVVTATIKSTYLPAVWTTTAPHHGSLATTLAVTSASSGGRGNIAAEKNLRKYVTLFESKTLIASAERKRRYYHPSAYILRFFWPQFATPALYVDPKVGNGRHFYTSYYDRKDDFQLREVTTGGAVLVDYPKFDWWYAAETDANLYSNLYVDVSVYSFVAGVTGTKLPVIPPDPGELADALPATTKLPVGLAWNFGKATGGGDPTLVPIVNRKSATAMRREVGVSRAHAVHALESVLATAAPVPHRVTRAAPLPRRESIRAPRVAIVG
jgi:hypothetical protein